MQGCTLSVQSAIGKRDVALRRETGLPQNMRVRKPVRLPGFCRKDLRVRVGVRVRIRVGFAAKSEQLNARQVLISKNKAIQGLRSGFFGQNRHFNDFSAANAQGGEAALQPCVASRAASREDYAGRFQRTCFLTSFPGALPRSGMRCAVGARTSECCPGLVCDAPLARGGLLLLAAALFNCPKRFGGARAFPLPWWWAWRGFHGLVFRPVQHGFVLRPGESRRSRAGPG